MSYWDILTKTRKIPGLSYDEDKFLSKNRNSDDASWILLFQILDGVSNVPVSALSGPARRWLEDNG